MNDSKEKNNKIKKILDFVKMSRQSHRGDLQLIMKIMKEVRKGKTIDEVSTDLHAKLDTLIEELRQWL